jgi:CRP-like cAMP-binding protein
MSTDRLLASLSQSEVFKGLDPSQLQALGQSGSTGELAAGETIIEEGRQVTELFVVLRGELEVFLPKTTSRLTRVRIARVGAGSCIGEYSFVDRNPASASVAARASTEIFRISHAEFERCLEADPPIGRTVYRNLLRVLVTRLREDNQLLDFLRPLPPKEPNRRSDT